MDIGVASTSSASTSSASTAAIGPFGAVARAIKGISFGPARVVLRLHMITVTPQALTPTWAEITRNTGGMPAIKP